MSITTKSDEHVGSEGRAVEEKGFRADSRSQDHCHVEASTTQ